MNEHLEKTIAQFQEKVQQQEAELRKTKQLVNSLCEAASISPIYPDAESEATNLSTLRRDQFYGRPLATVIREFLEMRRAVNRGAATTREIYEALVSGGYKFDTKNDANAMRTLQASLSKNGVFHRIPSGAWGLRDWYPSARPEKNGGQATDEAKEEVEESEQESENGGQS